MRRSVVGDGTTPAAGAVLSVVTACCGVLHCLQPSQLRPTALESLATHVAKIGGFPAGNSVSQRSLPQLSTSTIKFFTNFAEVS
jgi:hypothetical protein